MLNVWRYQICESVGIDAPVDEVYAFASNPELVPTYAPEIARIEIVRRLSEHLLLVKSHLKVAGLTHGFLYKYHYRPPTHYSGVQQGRGLLRGYFTLSFSSCGTGTNVSHTEGILSPVPLVAWMVGFIYFQLMARGGMREELQRLKSLVERLSMAVTGGAPATSNGAKNKDDCVSFEAATLSSKLSGNIEAADRSP